MSQRLVATIDCADGTATTVSASPALVTLDIPLAGVVVAHRCKPAHARRLAEALLLAARIADSGATP